MSKGLNEYRDQALRIAVEHGFEDATVGEDVALFHSEASELLEDHREGVEPTRVWYEEKILAYDADGKPIMIDGKHAKIAIRREAKSVSSDSPCPYCEGKGCLLGTAGDRGNPTCSSCGGTGKKQILYKPCGIPSEAADILIRVFHFCGKHGIDIEKAVEEKATYNETRPFKHGKVL